MSGPYAGMMLADLGADVIKIETGKGDPFRRYGRPKTPYSAVFANCNRSKRSVVLDLKDPVGRDDAARTARRQPTCSSRTGAPASPSRSACTDDVLAATNPRLVRCFVTGFGPGGPLAAEPAFDTVLQGAKRPDRRDHRARARPEPDPRLPGRQAGGDDGRPGDPRVAVRTCRHGTGDRIERADARRRHLPQLLRPLHQPGVRRPQPEVAREPADARDSPRPCRSTVGSCAPP